MKTLNVLLIIIVLFFAILGCDDEEKIVDGNSEKIIGTGDVISKPIDVSQFSSIMNLGVTNVYLTIGTPQSVILRAQKEILDLMTYNVANNELILSFKENSSFTTSKEISAVITVPSLNKITSAGTGNFKLSGAKQNELSITIIGTGNVEAYDLEVDNCNISITGTGNCRVRVNSILNATLTGTGNLYYKGNPSISATTVGTGSIMSDN